MEKNKTKTFVLRINTETMSAIEKWAADEFRSVNGQILYLLNEALKKNRRMRGKNEKNHDFFVN
ncbi:MAG: Arc family DNA-binding protein [Tannerella sp.]|jgi:hypothetical protein|nr:Arc family DNA-binding protein [Tannerella sp.]